MKLHQSLTISGREAAVGRVLGQNLSVVTYIPFGTDARQQPLPGAGVILTV